MKIDRKAHRRLDGCWDCYKELKEEVQRELYYDEYTSSDILVATGISRLHGSRMDRVEKKVAALDVLVHEHVKELEQHIWLLEQKHEQLAMAHDNLLVAHARTEGISHKLDRDFLNHLEGE